MVNIVMCLIRTRRRGIEGFCIRPHVFVRVISKEGIRGVSSLVEIRENHRPKVFTCGRECAQLYNYLFLFLSISTSPSTQNRKFKLHDAVRLLT